MDKLASLNITELLFPYAAMFAAIILLGLRVYMKNFVQKKRTLYTGRATGKIVGFKESQEDPGCFYPLVEFVVSGKAFQFKSSLSQFDQKLRGINDSENVLVRYQPSDPSQADLESEKLKRIEDIYLNVMLFLGVLAALTSIGLFFKII